VSEMEQAAENKPWPDYRAVWRWHFYAGLNCIPFVLVLSISGSLYLFKTEIEAWIDRPYDHLAVKGQPAKASEQIRAALAAVPDSSFQSYELPQAVDESARVIVRQDGRSKRVYVHPETLQVLHTSWEEERFMRSLFKIHGELLMGNRGSNVVELAASWTIVMILTGLVLWWPRGAKRLGGIVYPRLGSGNSRVFWRDLHSVTGFWVSGFVLVLLLTGLPWAKFWGDYLKNVRRVTGTAVARQDWTNGVTSEAAGGSGEHSEHGGSSKSGGGGRGNWSGRGGGERRQVDLSAVDRIVATVKPLGLLPPVVIAGPGGSRRSTGADGEGAGTDWTAKSMTPNRPYRVDLVVDAATGGIKSRSDFSKKHAIDRVVGTGIAYHEGRLFGWPNQMIGVLTAVGLVLLSVSSVVLWWKRREQGVLGAPKMVVSPRFSAGLLSIVVVLGVYLPMFGASLIAVKLIEKAVLIRIPKVRDWLGLASPSPSVVASGV
jgi:uncharacterized iron-regulated membrane protein